MKIEFNTKGIPEEYRQCIIKYEYRGKGKLPFEIGSAYYHNGWWVNFFNPYSFSKDYDVIGWSYYDFAQK